MNDSKQLFARKKNELILFVLFFGSIIVQGFAQASETGSASFYSDALEGQKTASGEIYNSKKMTAAHRTLAFGTRIKVTNLANKRHVIVMVNDRGPFVEGRIVDLSKAAAAKLGIIDDGVAKVRLEVLK